MRKKVKLTLWLLAVLLLFPMISFAGEVDILVQKLVDKGVLSGAEAQQILADTKVEAKKQMAKGQYDMLPTWLQTIKLKGDIRTRFEQIMYPGDIGNGATQDRHRGRFRLRFGLEDQINDQFFAAFRLEGGAQATTPEQTSPNTTFGSGFAGKSIFIGQAYLTYSPRQLSRYNFKLTGGKMFNPFYSTDMTWDPDINPEGAAAQMEIPVTDNLKIFGTLASFFTYESASQYDEPVVIGAQGGVSGKVLARDYKLGVAYYDWMNVKNTAIATIFPGKNFSGTAQGNTVNGSNYAYGFKITDVLAEVTPIDVKLFGNEMPLKLMGQFLTNNPGSQNIKYNKAWLAGFQLGKASDPKTWDFIYSYRVIGKNSNVAEIIDSDFHNGGVDSQGHKFAINYVPFKNTVLTCTFFNTKQYAKSSAKFLINTLQVDAMVKF